MGCRVQVQVTGSGVRVWVLLHDAGSHESHGLGWVCACVRGHGPLANEITKLSFTVSAILYYMYANKKKSGNAY
jgi:hypothetical protein